MLDKTVNYNPFTKIARTGLSVQATGTAAEDQAEWRAESDRLNATLKRFDIRLPE